MDNILSVAVKIILNSIIWGRRIFFFPLLSSMYLWYTVEGDWFHYGFVLFVIISPIVWLESTQHSTIAKHISYINYWDVVLPEIGLVGERKINLMLILWGILASVIHIANLYLIYYFYSLAVDGDIGVIGMYLLMVGIVSYVALVWYIVRVADFVPRRLL